MELISGFLLWTADIMGIRWVRKEKNGVRKAAKLLAYLVAGIVIVMLVFTLTYS